MLPVSILKFLNRALIYLYINYGIESWFEAPEYATNEVWVLQKIAAPNIYSSGCKDHTAIHFRSNQFLKKIVIHMCIQT